jgi:DNA-binding LacI/PurR family transcriptional regulator
VSAVEEAARQRGYYTSVARLGADSPDALAAAAGDLLDQDVEGIVVVAPRAGVMSGLVPLAGGVPLLAAQSGDDRGARMMMRYLIGQGHRRILHVAGPQDWDDAHARLIAYESELLLAGLPVPPARLNSTSTGQAGDDARPQHANPITPEDSEITGLCCSTSRFVNEVCVESGDCLFKQPG